MKNKIKIITLLSLVILINLVMIIFIFCSSIEVCVVNRRIEELNEINIQDIEYIKIPKYLYKNTMITNKQEIEGKYVKNNNTLYNGSIIRKDAIESSSVARDFIHHNIGDNNVNYDIFSNELKGNINHLTKGMRIDLYLTINNDNNPISDLLLKNIYINDIYDKNGKKIIQDGNVYSLNVSIKDEYVNYLNKALKIGELSFVVTKNAYNDVMTVLNKESFIFDYLK